MIIDPVMDFNFASGRTGSDHNDKVATFCEENKLNVEYICESHVHADHMTGGAGLRERFPGAKTGIGEHVTTVQGTFKKVFNLKEEFHEDGSQFDILFKDGQTFQLGNLEGRIMHTPGKSNGVGGICLYDVTWIVKVRQHLLHLQLSNRIDPHN